MSSYCLSKSKLRRGFCFDTYTNWEFYNLLDTRLKQTLDAGIFAITGEIGPPRGADHNIVIERTKLIADYCDAINITDNVRGVPTMSSMACARIVLDAGAEPIMQLSTRDRNRISIESELYGVYALGIRNILFITGDRTIMGPHSDAKMVFDIDSIQALQLSSHLMGGTNFDGEALEGTPQFFMGSTFNPYADSIEKEILRTEKKRDAGALFFQTQAIFDTDRLDSFMELVRDLKLKVLAGIIPLRGPRMARFMNTNVPGIKIPEEYINRLESAGKGLKEDAERDTMREEGLLIALEIIKSIRKIKGIDGLHLMGIGWEESIPELVKRAGLSQRPKME
ncbi:MAG: methylenetetrahydrofolate reductase [Candidatus Thorarchaeota archaeon]|nr:MAG: methylenetetrahydrofolate reductase [Candidatus Thorarchaeota archaeon]